MPQGGLDPVECKKAQIEALTPVEQDHTDTASDLVTTSSRFISFSVDIKSERSTLESMDQDRSIIGQEENEASAPPSDAAACSSST